MKDKLQAIREEALKHYFPRQVWFPSHPVGDFFCKSTKK